MDEQFFAWNLDINDALTNSLTSQIISVALCIAVICFICNLAHNYLTSGFSKMVGGSKENFPDYTEIARCFVLIICISSYLPIANIIVGTVETINKATSPATLANLETYQDAIQQVKVKAIDGENTDISDIKSEIKTDSNGNEYMVDSEGKKTLILSDEYKNKDDDSSSVFAQISGFLGKLVAFLNPLHFFTLGAHGIVLLIVSLIKIIITGIVVIMTKILVIVGPLAFAFSILPCFRKQIDTWFGALLNTGMTLTTINILDAIFEQITYHLYSKGANFDVTLENITLDYPLLIALDVVLIILYCSCFWLTSKYVGKGDSGRALSKLVAVGTALAAIAMSGGAGAAAKGTNVQNIANTAKSVIENNNEGEG